MTEHEIIARLRIMGVPISCGRSSCAELLRVEINNQRSISQFGNASLSFANPSSVI